MDKFEIENSQLQRTEEQFTPPDSIECLRIDGNRVQTFVAVHDYGNDVLKYVFKEYSWDGDQEQAARDVFEIKMEKKYEQFEVELFR